ncbi:MAG: hypothetical protein ACO1N3_04325 [Gammaproteobacteria bacterium]
MQDLNESRLKTIANLIKINNHLVEPREQVDFEPYRKAIVSNMKSVNTNLAKSEQEFDLITIGFVILALARSEAKGTTLTPYLSLPDQPISSPSLKQVEEKIYTWVPNTLRSPLGLRTNYFDGLYYALQIGYNVLNKKYSIDLDAMATNCRTVFSATMEDAELVALESWLRSRVITDEFVPSVCLGQIEPNRKEGLKSRNYIVLEDRAATLDANKYPELKQALLQWIPVLAEYRESVERTVDYTLELVMQNLGDLDNQVHYKNLDACIKDLKRYAGKTADSNAFIQQLQKISDDYRARRALFESERQNFVKIVGRQVLKFSDGFKNKYIRDGLSFYLCHFIPLTPDNLQTEKAIMAWGLSVMSMLQHPQQAEMLPYLTLDGNEINPTYQELKDLLKFEDLEAQPDRNDGYYAQDVAAKKIAAFILLIGKKIYNGEITINQANLQQNIQRMGKEYYVLDSNLPVNPRQDRPVHSKGLRQLVRGGEMHAIELFEEAVALCADSNKAELRDAIDSLWQDSLNTYRFPQTKNNFLKADADILTRRDLFILAESTFELAKKNDVAVFQASTSNIRKKMHNNATLIYRLDMVIQAAIGLGLGLAVGLACSSVLPAMAVGVCVGLASTRFGLWHQKEYQAYHKADVALEEVSRVGALASA